jgi:hypothetical protein
MYYGGRAQADVERKEEDGQGPRNEHWGVLGIDRVAEAGGVTTRGVILDYPRYRERKGLPEINALGENSISADELKEMLKETSIETRERDLLLLRTGFTRDYTKLSMEERKDLANKPPAFLGVESSKNVLEWIWESGFVAVAGDAPSFEMSPLVGEHNKVGGMWKGEAWEEEMQGGGLVHQWCLGGWGKYTCVFNFPVLTMSCRRNDWRDVGSGEAVRQSCRAAKADLLCEQCASEG